jgi:hypothetical protein
MPAQLSSMEKSRSRSPLCARGSPADVFAKFTQAMAGSVELAAKK